MHGLVYLGFLFWISAGLADFALHKRSDLAHTSGLRESAFHLAQLAIVGLAVAAWWALQPTWGAWWLAAVPVALHALIGYADTRSAWGKRAITPLEQHVHSVLDAAPWLFLGWYASAIPGSAGHAIDWQPRSWWLWAWIGLPASLVGLCALMEFLSAWRAAARPRRPNRPPQTG